MEVGVDDGRIEVLGELDDLFDALAHHDAAAGEDDRKLCLGDEFGGFFERGGISACAVQMHGFGDVDIDRSVEHVARDIVLRRSSFESRVIETSREHFGYSVLVSDVRLILGNFFEEGELLGFLKSAESLRVGACLRREDDDGRVRPVCCGDACHEVGDSWSVLRDAQADLVGGARVSVCHVGGTLFVGDRDESDSCGIEEVEGIHESGADDSEGVRDALLDERFYDGFGGGNFGHGVFSSFACGGWGWVISAVGCVNWRVLSKRFLARANIMEAGRGKLPWE